MGDCDLIGASSSPPVTAWVGRNVGVEWCGGAKRRLWKWGDG